MNNQLPCRLSCDHERHQTHSYLLKGVEFERQHLWGIAKYVSDPKISHLDEDDLELFREFVFESKFGRIHISFYTELFKNYYQFNPIWTLKVFSKYLLFLDKLSSLFSTDAFHFIFKKNDIKLISNLLKEMPLEIKLSFIKMSDKYPEMIKRVPKLKVYNLFS